MTMPTIEKEIGPRIERKPGVLFSKSHLLKTLVAHFIPRSKLVIFHRSYTLYTRPILALLILRSLRAAGCPRPSRHPWLLLLLLLPLCCLA
jgi:hypothetical protein